MVRTAALVFAAGAALAACGGSGSDSPAPGAAQPTRLLATTGTANAPRTMENLGRGVVAVRASSTSAFISWRLLGLDPADIAFNLYRATAGGAPVKLNETPLTGGTNFTDGGADLALDNVYTVRPIVDGVEHEASAPFALKANAAIEPVVRIPLRQIPGEGYRTKYVWVGDLDGDGEYDYVIDRIAPFDPANDDFGLGNQYLEAYKRDGTRLWQIDLGPSSRGTYNISPGAATLSMGMYDGVTVFDLDGNGKAEVILKVAHGVTFGDGSVFTDADPKQQHIAVLDGQRGTPLATRPFPAQYAARGPLGTQLGIGYPDGINPSIYFWGRNRNADKSFNDVFASWSWSGGSSISENWVMPLGNTGPREASHQMRIVDVDGDGRDEMATGNFMVNSDGSLRYLLPGVVHGDRFFIGKFDQSRPGLQGYGVQQNNPNGLLEYYYDATSGEVLWRHSKSDGVLRDVGRGLVGDVDPRVPGYEVWSFEGLFNGPSNTLAEPDPALRPYPTHSIWWDGDVLTEGLNDYKIEKWNPLVPRPTNALPRLLTMSNFGGRIHDRNPMFFGDILGDWRTEVVLLNASYSELLIFTTNLPSSTRLYTMAHNPAYRNHMTIKGYMQSGMLDYYLGEGMSTPVEPNIRYVGTGAMQMEAAQLAGGTLVSREQTGYHGSGYLVFPHDGGSARVTTIDGGAGGPKRLSIRYANGGDKPVHGVLQVGDLIRRVTFLPTGGWNTWSSTTVVLPLQPGLVNSVSFSSNGGGLAYLDELVVPANGTAPAHR